LNPRSKTYLWVKTHVHIGRSSADDWNIGRARRIGPIVPPGGLATLINPVARGLSALILLIGGGFACGPAGGGGAGGDQGSGGTSGDGGAGGGGATGDTGGAAGDGGEAGTGGPGNTGGAGSAGGVTGGAGSGGSVAGGGEAGGGAGGAGATTAGAGGLAATGGTGGMAATGGTGGAGGAAPLATLKAAAEQTGRLIGAAVGATHLADPSYARTAATQLNFITPENEMKWDATEGTRNVFSFDRADTILTFAGQNGLQAKGHTLVWHSQLPSWVADIHDATDLRNAMINHITQVALHFRGRVIAWDVVNEAVADSGPSLRPTVFQQLLGDRYIDDAFIAAHAADPYARLYYNDYGAEGKGTKSDIVYNLVQGMLARGVPIHGVGLQMHAGPTDISPSAADVASNMQRLAALGLDVMITEMDVQICSSDLQAQSRRFHDVVARCVAQPFCRAVTVWGISDKYSWLNGQSCATPRPLLFDDNYAPKPAHAAVLNALLGL
jgi:endo-1,4-beta-xylanase